LHWGDPRLLSNSWIGYRHRIGGLIRRVPTADDHTGSTAMPSAKRIVIVGGVAGGAAAATRARRLSEEAEIILFERGEHISFANCGLPYHIGGRIADRDALLVQTPERMRARYAIDVRTRTEVIGIDREAREVTVRDVATGAESTQGYDVLILSPGAAPVRPPIVGADDPGVFTLRNLADMDAIKQVADARAGGAAVVVGGGFIGLEIAEALRDRDFDVALVEARDQVFIAADPEMAAPVHEQLIGHGVDLRLGTAVAGIARSGERLVASLTEGGDLECDMVVMAVGVRPEAALARQAGLAIGVTGGIAVDDQMRTSDEHIFAVGDAVETPHLVSGAESLIPLAGPAARQARVAVDNAFGRPSVYARTQGTSICKVFDLAIGMTGLSAKAARAADVPFETITVHASSHASYYPGASPVSLKLLFDPDSGKVLGAQAVGADGVDKRIDVLAVAVRAGLTVEALAQQELSYAPPFGSAKDVVNFAGFVASNVRSGEMGLCHADDALAPRDDQQLLDVRTPGEAARGTIPGALNIPLDDLRERMGEVPRDAELLVFCQVGLRGYLACRILSQNGYTCRNLTGGYRTYHAATTRGLSAERSS